MPASVLYCKLPARQRISFPLSAACVCVRATLALLLVHYGVMLSPSPPSCGHPLCPLPGLTRRWWRQVTRLPSEEVPTSAGSWKSRYLQEQSKRGKRGRDLEQ